MSDRVRAVQERRRSGAAGPHHGPDERQRVKREIDVEMRQIVEDAMPVNAEGWAMLDEAWEECTEGEFDAMLARAEPVEIVPGPEGQQ